MCQLGVIMSAAGSAMNIDLFSDHTNRHFLPAMITSNIFKLGAIPKGPGTVMKPTKNNFCPARFLAVCLLIYACAAPGRSSAQTAYYQGKTLTILRGGSPGGYGDLQARALIPYLKKYIPGEPTIILEHKQGAAGRTAINYIYASTKPDGLTIGAVGNVLVSGPILGLAGSNYDLDKLIYLGSTESGSPTAFVTRKELGLDSVEKLRAATGLRIGANSVGHITYINGRLAAYLLGLKEPKFVVGYSSPERDVALIQGEVDGGSMSSATMQQNPSLAEKVHFHTVITVPKGRYIAPYSRATPEIDSFAKSETEHRLLNLYRAFDYPRWPYILAPGTPKELVSILREAMAKSFKDPGFAKEFKKLTGVDPSPITAETIEAAIKAVPRDPETIALYKHLADPGPMPPR
jgi:tripartite-type tricarboxylate transporter receptor subunit TctC